MPQLITSLTLLSVQGGEALPEGTMIAFDKNLLINMGVQMFNVILLVAALAFILYKPVKRFMAERSQRIADEIEAAQKDREDALELKEQYERLIADIEKERDEILHQAYKKAMEKSDQMLFDARREAESIHSRALAELETERQNMDDELRRQMIEIATLMAGRFVEVSIDRETQDRLIENALTEWEEG